MNARKVDIETVFTALLAGLFFGGLLLIMLWQFIFDPTGRKVALGLLACSAGFGLLYLAARCITWAINRAASR